MLTPQEIVEKKFTKALVGGYEMGLVDDFLEQLHGDYAALYKDNAVLKSKLKVLVEKVEEYRATEDSMRMTLIAAQKTSRDITEEAQKKSKEIMAHADDYAARRRAELEAEFLTEEERLAEAKRQTSTFRKQVLALLDGEREFLDRLGELVVGVVEKPVPVAEIPPDVRISAPEPTSLPVMEPAPVEEPMQADTTPIVPLTPTEVMPEPEVPELEPPQAAKPVPESDLSLDEMEESVGAHLAQAVNGSMTEEPLSGTPQVSSSFFDDAAESAPFETPAVEPSGGTEEVEFYKLFDQDPAEPPTETVIDISVFEEAPTPKETAAPIAVPAKQDPRAAETLDIARSISATLGDTDEIIANLDAFWDDEGPPTTKRPKFDFENLQFGANYEEDE